MNVAFPLAFDTTGRTAQDSLVDHVNHMIELILFTSPGERVNLPTFGSGTAQLVFAPNSDVLAAAEDLSQRLDRKLSDDMRDSLSAGLDQMTSTMKEIVRRSPAPKSEPQPAIPMRY